MDVRYWRHLPFGHVVFYSFAMAVLLTLFINVAILFKHPERAVQLIDYFNLPPIYLSTSFVCRDICNDFPQKPLIQPAKQCEDIYLLFLVLSSHANRGNRDAVRRTWASKKVEKDKIIEVIFVLGISPFADAKASYLFESKQHGDILVFNITDAYYSLTNKTILAVNWVSEHCPTARFIMKTDDDSFNVPSAIIKQTERYANNQDVLLGQCASGMRPYRDPRNRWFTSELEYPGSYFPLYLRGRGYIMSQTAMRKLLRAAIYVSFNKMEDVFWTGLCRLKANIQAICLPGFLITEDGIMASQCQVKSHDLLNIHHVSRTEMISYWSWINGNYSEQYCVLNNMRLHSATYILIAVILSMILHLLYKMKC